MSSHSARTHTSHAPPPRSGFNLGTLLIAALSAVVAATVVSRLWQAGTVMATAMTPVLVTMVREALERPARRVSSIAARSSAPSVARTARAIVPPPPAAQAPPPPMVADPELTQMRVYGHERRTGRRWKLAIATGLLGFVICVAVVTVPELVAGRSVVSGKHDTTIFGGQRHVSSTKPKTTTDEKTTTETTPKDQMTSTPQTDTTTTAPTTPTQPAPQAAPTQPAPPTQTQPAPPTQTQPPAAPPTPPTP